MPERHEPVRLFLFLGLLMDGEMHGYRLNGFVAHVMALPTAPKRSSAYHTLQTLERDGYVEHEVQREGRRPERRVYRITEQGRAFFSDLLRSQLSEFTRSYYLDDVSTAFLDRLPPPEARNLLVEKREKVLTALRRFGELPGHSGGWRHIVSRNVAHLEAELVWLDGVLEELQAAPAEPPRSEST